MGEKVRQYLINGKELMPAYDLNEALVQWHIKTGGLIPVTEIMPVTIAEDTINVDSKAGDKKQVHVKPSPVKSPDTD